MQVDVLGYLSQLKYKLKIEGKNILYTEMKVSSSRSFILHVTFYRLCACETLL